MLCVSPAHRNQKRDAITFCGFAKSQSVSWTKFRHAQNHAYVATDAQRDCIRLSLASCPIWSYT